MIEGVTGYTAKTPENILFGACTVHKGLTYDASKKTWNTAESLVGATNGGSKLDIVPDIQQVPVDGVYVAMIGTDVKTGETATMEINFAELTKDIITASTLGAAGVVQGDFDVIESKVDIVAGDYWPNVALFGKTVTGRPVIAILDNALCTSGLPIEGKNKESGVQKVTFRCTQAANGDPRKLPWHIYYPKATT